MWDPYLEFLESEVNLRERYDLSVLQLRSKSETNQSIRKSPLGQSLAGLTPTRFINFPGRVKGKNKERIGEDFVNRNDAGPLLRSIRSQQAEHAKTKIEFPDSLLEKIFSYLEFQSLLKARLVCPTWNRLISNDILPKTGVLHFNYVPQSRENKFWVKRFRKGKWDKEHCVKWKELHVHKHRSQPLFHQKIKKDDSISLEPVSYSSATIEGDHKKLKGFYRGRKTSLSHLSSSLTHLEVKESDLTYNDLVRALMSSLTNVNHLKISEIDFNGMKWRYGPSFRHTKSPLFGFKRKHGKKALVNIQSLTIQLYERVSMLVYIRLFYRSIMASGSTGNLVECTLDFSRATYLMPVNVITNEVFEQRFREIFHAIKKLLGLNRKTLRILRLKFIPRVDIDSLLVLYDEQTQPLLAFLAMMDEFEIESLANSIPENPQPEDLNPNTRRLNQWGNFDLRELDLIFPIFNPGLFQIDSILIPFLKSQRNLQRLGMGRVQWDFATQNEINREILSSNRNLKIELHTYIKDFDRASFPLPLCVTQLEFHTFWMIAFNLSNLELGQGPGQVRIQIPNFRGDLPPAPLQVPPLPQIEEDNNGNTPPPEARQIQRRRHHHRHHHHHRRPQNLYWDVLYRRPYFQIKVLRFINSKYNPHFFSFNIDDVLARFPNLRELELLDNSVAILAQDGFAGSTDFKAIVTNDHLKSIFHRLPMLVSFKISNLFLLSDEGLTGVKASGAKRMRDTGIYLSKNVEDFEGPSLFEIPKNLKYLELRDLTEKVSDISIIYGIQLIEKLDKVCFHGTHLISEWGLSVLRQKFKTNPEFRAYLRTSLLENFEQDFP